MAVVVLGATGVAVGLWERQRELARARRTALYVQRELDLGPTRPVIGKAEALYNRHPALAEAGLVWAQMQFRNGDMRFRVIPFLERRLRHDPSRWPCRVLLAEIYRATTEDSERAAVLEAQAEADAPDTAEAWYLRSFATLDLQRARRCAQEAVKRDPSHALAWERLTSLLLETGDLDGALRAADKLIELGQDLRTWTSFKGDVLVT